MPIYRQILQGGQMINHVALESVSITKDVYGAPVRTWIRQFETWAALTFNGTSEFFTGTREEATESVTCVMRYDPNFLVLASWRVVDTDTDAIYAITSISYDPRRSIIVLQLRSGSSEG